MPRTKYLISLIMVVILISTIVGMCNPIKAQQELSYTITDNEIIVSSTTFEIHISKGGGIAEYHFRGYLILGSKGVGTALILRDKDWRARPTTIATPIKDPEIEKCDWGLLIKTYSEDVLPAKSFAYRYTTIHKIYKSGAIVMSTVVEAIEDSKIQAASIMFKLPCGVYSNGKFIAYRQGAISFTVDSFPPEYIKEALEKGHTITRGMLDSGYLALAPEGKINVVIIFIDPPEIKRVDVQDARRWREDAFWLRNYVAPGWSGLDLIPRTAGDSYNFTWIVFPHNSGSSFSERIINILVEGKNALNYINKVEEIAKSAKARDYIQKARASLSELIPTICSGDLDKAEELATNAYEYARSAYSTEVTQIGIRYIIIPILICVALYGLAAKKWKGGAPEEEKA